MTRLVPRTSREAQIQFQAILDSADVVDIKLLDGREANRIRHEAAEGLRGLVKILLEAPQARKLSKGRTPSKRSTISRKRLPRKD